MIKIERKEKSDSKYMNMTKRELINEIVQLQVKDINMAKEIKRLNEVINGEESE